MVNGMVQIAMSWESLSTIDSQATTIIFQCRESAYMEGKSLYWDGASAFMFLLFWRIIAVLALSVGPQCALSVWVSPVECHWRTYGILAGHAIGVAFCPPSIDRSHLRPDMTFVPFTEEA